LFDADGEAPRVGPAVDDFDSIVAKNVRGGGLIEMIQCRNASATGGDLGGLFIDERAGDEGPPGVHDPGLGIDPNGAVEVNLMRLIGPRAFALLEVQGE